MINILYKITLKNGQEIVFYDEGIYDNLKDANYRVKMIQGELFREIQAGNFVSYTEEDDDGLSHLTYVNVSEVASIEVYAKWEDD